MTKHEITTSSLRRRLLPAALLAVCAPLLVVTQSSAATAGPAWDLTITSMPTNFKPEDSGNAFAGPQYYVVATNVGAAPTTADVTLEATLPDGVTAIEAQGFDWDEGSGSGPPDPSCEVVLQVVTCTTPGPYQPGRFLGARILVEVSASAQGSPSAEARISGGGAVPTVTAIPTPIAAEPAPFAILPTSNGFRAPLTDSAGAAATLAGSHPYQLTVDLGFPTRKLSFATLVSNGHPRDIVSDLPPGLIVNPAATPVLCTERELTRANAEGIPSTTAGGCPLASQVGLVTLTTITLPTLTLSSPLYNMVPPPGQPASLAFDAANVAISYTHLLGAVRSDSDYGLTATVKEALALGTRPIFTAQVQLWGDPSAESHDSTRGDQCLAFGSTACPVPAQRFPLLTMPTHCGGPLTYNARADSWEEPGVFSEASYESADLQGNPVGVEGCNQLDFEPTISSQPTTNLTDSPSGLDFGLHQPQESFHDEPLTGRATARLKDATVTLPAGMTVNPSQADGLAACSQTQIGLLSEEEGVHFSKQPDSCPDAAKLGTVEVATPLLARYDDEHKLQTDPETGAPLLEPLHGSVYLAEPFDNPFGSLAAIYLSIADKRTGVVTKLAGKVELDPVTGQIATRFVENPQLPIEDVRVRLFGGARGALITPHTCAAHTTTSTLTPWSSPEGVDAHPVDSFQTVAQPGGGSCPQSEAQAPNSPAFTAGTIAPQAGAYSPFVLKLSREDGSQRLAEIDATLPPGLIGKLAGIGRCSEAQLAQAQARSHPNEGILERDDPSCPSGSQLGTVDVAAGAGPTPLHVQGTAYLAGPYKGAPLSVAVVTPAIAGPFDLGAVVVRAALQVDPETAQIHAVSDSLPQILEGIPLDVRSIALRMDRPQFTLNPTSCDPMQIVGSALSSLGQRASLTSPFQVGGCQSLPFKPKLSLRLKGGTKRASHPKLIATLKAKPGEANIASAQVKLPPSAFLDQAHIRTICTRVQFAADACPKGSIYGKASATTPLLDSPLSGNVYLRSSNHKLPDLVVALKGPESLPIEIDLAGKTDSVKGALRNTFEAVPDAPVSKFRLELFGGKRGLVVNSRNLCAHPYKAEVAMGGQNGKVFDTTPLVRSDCGGMRKHGRHGKAGR